jgi:hypothetical protein
MKDISYRFNSGSLKKLKKRLSKVFERAINNENKSQVKLLGVKDVCRLTRVSITTVCRNISKFNVYSTVFRIGRKFCFDKNEIERLATQKHNKDYYE